MFHYTTKKRETDMIHVYRFLHSVHNIDNNIGIHPGFYPCSVKSIVYLVVNATLEYNATPLLHEIFATC